MALRAAEVVLLPDRIPTLADAVEGFFSDKDLSPNTRRTYRQALDALVADLGQNMTISHLMGLFGFQWGVTVARRSQLGFPA